MNAITKTSVKTEIIDVTPSIATAWLEKNTHNRTISQRVVEQYARDMSNGDWQMTAEAIKFDDCGNLLDGQHRLWACIEADTPFRALIAYGLSKCSQDVMDTGKKRSASDALDLYGYNNSKILASAARWIIGYKKEQSRVANIKASNSEILSCIGANKYLPASCNNVKGIPVGQPGLFAFLHYVGTHYLKLPDRANKFIDVFRTGIPERQNCPAHRARERLVRETADNIALKRDAQTRCIMHAWNLFAAEETGAARFTVPSEVEIDGLDRNKLKVE